MAQLRKVIEEYLQDLREIVMACQSNDNFLEIAKKKWGNENIRFLMLKKHYVSTHKENPRDKPQATSVNLQKEVNLLIDNTTTLMVQCQDDLILRQEIEMRSRQNWLYRIFLSLTD
jgi:hypothetical protein